TRQATLRRPVAGAVCAARAARALGHALPPAVLSGAGALVRLGITAHDRELPRVPAVRPSGRDGLHDAPGAHSRAGAGLPDVRRIPAPAGAERTVDRRGPVARLDLRGTARGTYGVGGTLPGGARRRVARRTRERRDRRGEHPRPADVRLLRL